MFMRDNQARVRAIVSLVISSRETQQSQSGNLQSAIGNVFGAPAGIRTPNQQIMRRFEDHQQGETK
jgi:hypothetical protein